MIRPRWIWSTQRSLSRFRSSSSTSASIPWAIHAAFQPTWPAPITTTRAGPDPRRAAEQHSAGAVLVSRGGARHLGRDAPGDLAHRREQWQLAESSCTVSYPSDVVPRSEQRRRDGRVGGEVQIGEEGEVLAEVTELGRLRLLHLADEVGRPGGLRVDALGPCGGEIAVGEAGAVACSFLDEDAVAARRQLAHAVGGHRDAVLARLDLGGDADDHGGQPLLRGDSCGRPGTTAVTARPPQPPASRTTRGQPP